jgi:hypothetical protein
MSGLKCKRRFLCFSALKNSRLNSSNNKLTSGSKLKQKKEVVVKEKAKPLRNSKSPIQKKTIYLNEDKLTPNRGSKMGKPKKLI